MRDVLTTPLPSTGLLPHFGTTSDKSTPAHISNHAIMILVIYGKWPKDSHSSRCSLRVLIFWRRTWRWYRWRISRASCICPGKNIEAANDCVVIVDGSSSWWSIPGKNVFAKVECAQGTTEQDLPAGHDIFFVIPWDTAHWMDQAVLSPNLKAYVKAMKPYAKHFLERGKQTTKTSKWSTWWKVGVSVYISVESYTFCQSQWTWWSRPNP